MLDCKIEKLTAGESRGWQCFTVLTAGGGCGGEVCLANLQYKASETPACT